MKQRHVRKKPKLSPLETRIEAMDPKAKEFYANLVQAIRSEFRIELNPDPDQERPTLGSKHLGLLR